MILGAPHRGLALRLARRELRGGLDGFRVMLACLVLGVAAIAGVGSLSAAVGAALTGDAQALLGGDVDLDLTHRQASPDERAALAASGRVSETADLRAMARAASGDVQGGRPILVELKAVDRAYPLYGSLALDPPLAPDAAFKVRDGTFGAAVAPEVLDRLGLKLGDRVKIGAAIYDIRAVIRHEPDRGADAFILGPRFTVGWSSLAATGLIQPGSLVHYHYRVALRAGTDARAWLAALGTRFPDAGWRTRSRYNAAPRLQSFLDRLGLFLTLVGLTALLVGGVGVANAIKAYLDGRASTIAILKCLGASGRLVFQLYLAETLVIALAGILLGLALGAAVPIALGGVLARYLPVVAQVGLYPRPLLIAAAYGLLTTLCFTLWPLSSARDVPAVRLFRAEIAPERHWPRPAYGLALLGCCGALAALTVRASPDRHVALWFVAGTLGALAAFRLAAFAIGSVSRLAARNRLVGRGRPTLRLALANLGRPGAPTPSVVLSLGVGLTLLVAVGLVEGNLDREVTETLPDGAPAYFFIDIQPNELAAFDRAVTSVPGASDLEQVPSLRGRITRIAGIPVEQAIRAGRNSWALDSDRGLTYAAARPRGAKIVAGKWWPPDYHGPPLVSLDADVARQLRLRIGDTLTVDVLGREVTATIASLRQIDWSTLGINFVMLFSPGLLDHAPQTYIATIKADPGAEIPVLRAATDRFPNITAIRVRDALDQVASILGRIGTAVRLTAVFTLVVGTLVLGSAVAAEHKRRVRDAVVLKVLGATRPRLLATFLIEYGVLGIAAAAAAAAIGTLAGYLLVTRVMHGEWAFLPATVAGAIIGCTLLTLIVGFAGCWRALGLKAAPLLRND